MRKKFLTILMSMLMVFVMMPVITGPVYAEDYNLWVGGEQVNSDNAENIPGVDSGKASYDATTNTLTLDGATITKGYSGRNIESDIRDLTIKIKGENSLTGGSIGIQSSEDFTITGDGSLQAEGSDLGIYSSGSVTIDGTTVTATGSSTYGIYASESVTISNSTVSATGGNYGISSGGSLTIKSGTVSATGGNNGIISGGSLTIKGSSKVHAEGTHSEAIYADEGISIGDGLVITEPVQGGVSDNGRYIVDQDYNTAKSVTIVPSENYNLWVGGTQVTTDNCNDIPAAEGSKTGKASYDPFKNILTLDGYKYTGPGYYDKSITSRITASIYSKLADELTIELIGENEVIVEETTNAGNHDGIYSDNDLVIEGSGSLEVGPGDDASRENHCYGIEFAKRLTIGGDCTVNAKAPSGSKVRFSDAIIGRANSHLTIKDRCTVNAAGGDTSGTDDTYSFGIDVWNDLEITGGKVVATGRSAQYSFGIRIRSSNGTTKIAPADNSAIEVEASGENRAIYGKVINTIGGVGWMDTGGTGNADTIAISDSARELKNGSEEYYKKVRFPAYMINVTADPEEGGTVTGGGTYEKGKSVTLKAEAKDGYVFVNWTENGEEVKDGSGQAAGATYTFDATKDRDLTANFRIPLTITAKAQTYLYTGQTQGEGDTVYNDPDEIAAKVEVAGLKDGDVLTKIELSGQKKEVGEHAKCIEAKGAKILRGEGDAAVDVTNSYEITYVKGDMTIVGPEVQVKKTLDGRDWTNADSFEFTLSPVNGAPMPDGMTGDKITLTKADKDAGFTKGFGAIPFTQPGKYEYTVTETHKGETIKGVSYDSNDKTVTFEIKGDDNGNVVADGSTLLQTAEFTNTYSASGEVSLKASKSVSGADWPEGAEATFTLSSPDGTPMPNSASVTLTAPGDAEFGPIIYDLSDAGKTYTYTIRETGTKGFDGWFTDKESVSVAVAVGTDKGDGTLSDAVVTYTPENTEITNTPVQWKFIDFTWTGDETSGYTEAAANYESTNTAGRTKTVKADISEEVTAPTCNEDGKTVYTAEVSKENSPDGEAHSESRDAKPISKTGHSLTKTDEVAASCEKAGTKAYWTCSKCKKMFSDEKGENVITAPEVIEASGHDWEEWTVTKEATETEEGEEQRVCKNDPEHKETRVIPVIGHEHKLTETPAKAATCTEDGNSAYWTCDKGDNPCGRYFSDSEGTTEIEKDSWVITATGHDWGEWTVTKEATETEEGEEQRVCKNDPEHKETRAIPVIPASVTYSNVSGEGNIWYKGSDATSDFSFKRSVDDTSTFSHFTGIRVDNNPVNEANYSKEPGSVIIKLKPEYLETLALGKHTLEARFDDGNGSATAEFTIAEAEEENTDDEGDDVDDNGGGSKGGKKNVKTGDESLVAFWASLLGVSLIGLIMLFAAKLRLRRKDR